MTLFQFHIGMINPLHNIIFLPVMAFQFHIGMINPEKTGQYYYCEKYFNSTLV